METAIHLNTFVTLFRNNLNSRGYGLDSDSYQLNIIFNTSFMNGNGRYPCTVFAFMTFINGTLESGIKIVLEESRLSDYIKDADIVVTGEGRLDGQTVMGKAPIGVAKIAKQFDKPVLAFSGCVTKDATACNREGIDAFFPVLRNVVSLEDAMNPANARQNMADTAEQVFRTIRTFSSL